MRDKERFRKFNDSLAASMSIPMTYVPIFTFVHEMEGMGIWFFIAFIGLSAFCFFQSFLLYKFIGDVNRTNVDQNRRIIGYITLFVISFLLMIGYMYFFEEAEPMIRWSAWIVMVVILFIAAYSICKQYIMKNE
ncbi:MAG: hypothetical protein IJL37_10735 [Bacteroidaceae bacterium]|nr:hypothetical protein [Bacteroidaceae bacterium]MBQ9499935.1 hypothetical protein [Bacteroidaceae bacterium]